MEIARYLGTLFIKPLNTSIMSTNPFKSSLMLLTALFFLAVSCSEPYELQRPDVDVPEIDVVEEVYPDYFVRTYEPTIVGDVTTFYGEIVAQLGSGEMEYGFMWYDPEEFTEDEGLIIQEIVVGSTIELATFTTEVVGLPNEKELIVCSFVRSSQQETYIGDEVPF